MSTNTIVQYIVIRGDLSKTLNWPMGAMIAQACHASTAAMHLFKDDKNVLDYTKVLDHMHKVVLGVSKPQLLHR